MHVHDHSAGGHFHATHSSGKLGGAMLATVALAAAEFIAGSLGHSMALLSDAVHNLTDLPTIAISWLAARWSIKPATPEKTYGYHRSGILAAFVNSLILILVALYILFEAIERLRQPASVHTGLMLWIAVLALCVNGGITLALMRNRADLNQRSILIHNFGDALSNVAILIGALAIRWTGARWIDPAIGLAIGIMVLWSATGILRESSHILLEGLPRNLQLEDVARAVLEIPNVEEVHDIHIWTIGADLHALSCHVRIPDMHMDESEKLLRQIRGRLAERFQITHSTIQFERAGLPPDAGYFMPEPMHPTR
ncbi:MAG TPA: cation diffusion facilitator family transporter [Candidatus Acidoferrales bacterium]|nr:cation diffusion facilitator family transporter [Candidatus Acidoferrales bacterium]